MIPCPGSCRWVPEQELSTWTSESILQIKVYFLKYYSLDNDVSLTCKKAYSQRLDSDLSRSYPPTPKTKSMSTDPNFASLICAIPLICCYQFTKSNKLRYIILFWIFFFLGRWETSILENSIDAEKHGRSINHLLKFTNTMAFYVEIA